MSSNLEPRVADIPPLDGDCHVSAPPRLAWNLADPGDFSPAHDRDRGVEPPGQVGKPDDPVLQTGIGERKVDGDETDPFRVARRDKGDADILLRECGPVGEIDEVANDGEAGGSAPSNLWLGVERDFMASLANWILPPEPLAGGIRAFLGRRRRSRSADDESRENQSECSHAPL